jgi:hypothetical protein
MIYSVDLTIPAATPASALVSTSFSIAPGAMRQEFITFPDGCAGLAYARVVVRERVLYPTNPDSWLHSNGVTLPFADELEIEGSGEHIRLEGYNLDTVNAHTITLMLVVVPFQLTTLDLLLSARPSFAGPVAGG